MIDRHHSGLDEPFRVVLRHQLRGKVFRIKIGQILVFRQNEHVEAKSEHDLPVVVLQDGHLLLQFDLLFRGELLAADRILIQQRDGRHDAADRYKHRQRAQKKVRLAADDLRQDQSPYRHVNGFLRDGGS